MNNKVIFFKKKVCKKVQLDNFDYKSDNLLNTFKNIKNISNEILDTFAKNSVTCYVPKRILIKTKEELKQLLLSKKINGFEKRVLFSASKKNKILKLKKKIFLKNLKRVVLKQYSNTKPKRR
ncbi:MAG: hypothetical protein LBH46_04180 [Rickettsiales bacterium]|jgi:hypothetical protein|nr:hypothetical protein [Rickettsiales bacterium]